MYVAVAAQIFLSFSTISDLLGPHIPLSPHLLDTVDVHVLVHTWKKPVCLCIAYSLSLLMASTMDIES